MATNIEPPLGDVIFSSYNGSYKEETSAFHGPGTVELDNGCNYSGHFKDGLFHGKGKLVWPNGVKFEGTFEFGVMQGKGIYNWPDGSSYNGGIKNGLRHGQGKFKCSFGQVYDGEWSEGKRNGHGKMLYNSEKNYSYIGDWINNRRQGYGIMKYPSGNTYEGEWFDDRKEGQGVMIWKDVDEIYTGVWLNDLPHGFGEYIWAETGLKGQKKQTCNIFRGNFENGLRNGYGSFFYMNGSSYTGEWKDGQKEGSGVFIFADGRIFSGDFKANRRLNPHFSDADPPHLRATEDVSSEYCLNIHDVFGSFGTPLSESLNLSTTSTVAVTNPTLMTRERQLKEIERVLLKYNQYLKYSYKRASEFANIKRQKELNKPFISSLSSPTNLLENSCSRVDKACILARNFHKKLFCMNLEQMLRFLREVGLIGPYFRSYDLGMCWKTMQEHYVSAATNKMIVYKQQLDLGHLSVLQEVEDNRQMKANPDQKSSPTGEMSRAASVRTRNKASRAARTPVTTGPAPLQTTNTVLNPMDNFQFDFLTPMDLPVKSEWGLNLPVQIGKILDHYLEPQYGKFEDFDLHPLQPIVEREFPELLVRCIAESYSRQAPIVPINPNSNNTDGLTSVTLFQTVYYVIANKVMPIAADFDTKVSDFYRVFYHDDVQDAIHNASLTFSLNGSEYPVLRFLWGQLRIKAGEVNILDLSGGGAVEIKDFLNFMKLLLPESVSLIDIIDAIELAPTIDGKLDYSCTNLKMDYEDFLEFLCRLMCSELWIFHLKPVKNTEVINENTENYETQTESPQDTTNDPNTSTEEEKQLMENEANFNTTETENEEPLQDHEELCKRLNLWMQHFDFSVIC